MASWRGSRHLAAATASILIVLPRVRLRLSSPGSSSDSVLATRGTKSVQPLPVHLLSFVSCKDAREKS